jgi:hypothetical protein
MNRVFCDLFSWALFVSYLEWQDRKSLAFYALASTFPNDAKPPIFSVICDPELVQRDRCSA